MAVGKPGRGGPPGVITEPVPRPLQRVLRRAVLDHARGERRRRHPPVLHVGVPGVGAARTFVPTDDPLDQALRTDVLEAMLRPALDRRTVPLVWLTRESGSDPTEAHESDHAWARAVTAAGAELGVALSMVVVTRRGWRDPRTGVGRTWQRVRER